MRREIRYIEKKSGRSDHGPAWIARVGYSKTGRTVYFKNLALKAVKGGYCGGNHIDRASGEVYWISGVKKNEWNRHWAGGGEIMIESSLMDWYRSFVHFKELGFLKVIADFDDMDTTVHHEAENEEFSEFD